MRPTPAWCDAGLGDPRIDLGAGQLAALAGLGALGHLDLEFAALVRYSLVTPKRPEATCLMAEFFESPFALVQVKRAGSSPPSPVLDLPPMRFIAMASVSCASLEMEP
jgi:hypothetical protein